MARIRGACLAVDGIFDLYKYMVKRRLIVKTATLIVTPHASCTG